MPKRLLVVMYPGVADWEVTFPLFCLRPAIEDTFVSIGPERIRTAMGFEIDIGLVGVDKVNVDDFDGVYLPGGIDPVSDRFPRSLGENQDLLGLLRAFAEKDRVIAAICGAPLVLGAAGLLREKRFTTDITEDTRGWFEGATRIDDPICVDGKILTGSVTATIPFAVELARLLGDDETARQIKDFFAG